MKLNNNMGCIEMIIMIQKMRSFIWLNNNMGCIEIGLISYKDIGIQLNNNM